MSLSKEFKRVHDSFLLSLCIAPVCYVVTLFVLIAPVFFFFLLYYCCILVYSHYSIALFINILVAVALETPPLFVVMNSKAYLILLWKSQGQVVLQSTWWTPNAADTGSLASFFHRSLVSILSCCECKTKGRRTGSGSVKYGNVISDALSVQFPFSQYEPTNPRAETLAWPAVILFWCSTSECLLTAWLGFVSKHMWVNDGKSRANCTL